MAEVLVLVDHVDGDVRKSTAEALTAATRLGEPSAVFVGDGVDAARDVLARYGAAKVYRLEGADYTDHLVAPVAEALAQLVEKTGLSGTDRVLGICFGALRGVLIIAAILFFLDTFTGMAKSDDWHQSQFIPYFTPVIRWFFEYLQSSSSFLPKV